MGMDGLHVEKINWGSVSDNLDFQVTSHQSWVINVIMSVGSGLSLLMCAFVLLSAAWIHTFPKSKTYMDRLSFRLLLWSMGFQVIYDIAHLSLYAPTAIMKHNQAGCAAGMFFRLMGINVVNFLFTCIAINLMLTIVFEISPIEYHLEKVYLGGSISIGILIPVTATSLGAFGWDNIFHNCYFAPIERELRVKHFIFDLYLWQSLACIIASVCVIITLVRLFRQTRATKRATTFAALRSVTESTPSSNGLSIHSKRTARGWFLRKALSSSEYEESTMTMYQLQDKLYGIALRISVYPIVLIFLNSFVTAGDLYTAVKGSMHSHQALWLTSIHMSICGARGVFFASVCIFVDPCLLRGIRAALQERKQRKPRTEEALLAQREGDDLTPGQELVEVKPAKNCADYSPKFIPQGQTPLELGYDPFSLSPFASDLLNESKETTTPILAYQGHGGPSRRTRNDSEISMDFAQALAASGSAASLPGFQSRKTSTLDFQTALAMQGTPKVVAAPFDAAYSMTPVHSSTVVNTNPGDQSFLGRPQGQLRASRQTSGGSIGMNTALGLEPSPSQSLSPVGLDTRGGPGASGPALGYRRDSSRADNHHKGLDEEAHIDGESGKETSGSASAGEVMRLRRQARKRNEWVRGLEKLYEEAEAQL